MTPVPSGEGLVVRRVRLAVRDVIVLGAMLSGEDHLASIHGEARSAESSRRVTVAVLTTDSRAAELDAWLADLAGPLDLEVLSAP